MATDPSRAHRTDSSFRVRVGVTALWTVGLLAVLTVVPVAVVEWSPWGTSTTRVTRVLVAIGLALAGLAVAWAAWDRSRRAKGPGARWFTVLAVAGGLLYAGQAVANLVTLQARGPYPPLTDALPLVLFGGFAVMAITALTWPYGLEPAERRAALVDGGVGAAGLAVVWAMLLVPAQPDRGAGASLLILVSASVIEFTAVVLVLVLAAAARRRAAVPIIPLILLQLGVLVYVGADTLASVLPFADRVTEVTLSSVGFVVAVGLVASAALRPAGESESARQLRVRDVWSGVVPLSPVPIAAGVLLVALLGGRSPGPLAAGAIALLLLLIISAVLWLRLAARAELRRATVTAAISTFSQATDQPWFQALIQNSRDIVIVVDRRNRVVYASPTLCGHLGSELRELQGRPLTTIVPQLTPSSVRSAQRFPDRPAQPLEVALTDHTGAEHDVQFHVSLLVGLGAEGYVLTGQDVTDTRRMRLLLGESRRRDRLTGLMNTDSFTAAVQEAQTWSDARSLAVVVFDICDLRSLIDARGRDCGDAIMSAVAGALEQASGPILAVSRLHQDAFAALVRDPVPDGVVATLTEGLRSQVNAVVVPGGATVKVRMAVGYSTGFADSERAVDLVAQADLAATHSLTSPHLPVVRFEHQMRESLLLDWEQRAAVERALEGGEFVPYYQPIVAIGDGSVVGVEALARRRLPDGSVQLPGQFIPAAQRVGQVPFIDAAIRAQALADLHLLNQRWPELSVSLNIAPGDFDQASAGQLVAEVQRADVDPQRVTFEFTEATVAASVELAAAVLDELHDHGFTVALDDFGTGFSSLSSLRDLSVDVVKVDQVFLEGLSSSPRAISLLRAMIDVGRSLGLTTVVEGVRTVEQADLLRGMGCDRIQGHLHAEALPLVDLVEWLETRPVPTRGQVRGRRR